MEITTHFGTTPVTLVTNGFEERVDIDQLTSINYENLYGEAATISALLNKVGMLRADAECTMNEKKLERDVCEAELKKQWRSEANRNQGKFEIEGEEIKLSEKALDEALLLDEDYQNLCVEYINAQKNFGILDALQWAIQDKSKKLNNLLKPVTPAEFLNELVEGKVNTFLVKKQGF
jgi:hypothetical protein